MKRSLAALMAVFVMLFAFIGNVNAETATAPDAMKKAISKQIKAANYDFDNGSLKLNHVEKVQLQKPVDKVSTLYMAVAQYTTVRDNIFFATHRDIVYYSPDTGKVLSATMSGKIDATSAYKDKYESVTGDNVQVITILIFMFLILLIPALLAYVWAKRQHSVITYKLENDLFDDTGDKKYS